MCPDGITPSASKRCNQCGEVKPATTEFFAPEKRGIYGVKAVCRECKKLYYRANRASKLEVKRAQCRAWYAANREEQNRKSRERYAADPAKSLAISAEWRRRPGNADRNRAYSANARARQHGMAERITADDIRHVFSAQRGRCAYCGCDVSTGYHIDHATPFCRGGLNIRENLVLACPSCNQKKRHRLPSEFLAATHIASS